MPLRPLKYGLSADYPVTGDIPATPELKSSYDVVIVGGGGHGLACAHYLSKCHGITNVAVLEKGYLAGGNTARNTTTIRSNYITKECIAFYKEGVQLYEEMSEELDFNVMFSQRGQLTLAHTEATLRSFHLRAEMGKHAGTNIEVVDAQAVRDLSPHLNMDEGGHSKSWAACGIPTAAQRGTMRWPGAMPRRPAGAGWKSTSALKSKALTSAVPRSPGSAPIAAISVPDR